MTGDPGDKLRRHIEQAQSGFISQLDHAVRCGQALREAEAQLPAGYWAPWVEEHLSFGVDTAQIYMRVADPQNARALREAGVDGAVRELVERPQLAADSASLLAAMLDRMER